VSYLHISLGSIGDNASCGDVGTKIRRVKIALEKSEAYDN